MESSTVIQVGKVMILCHLHMQVTEDHHERTALENFLQRYKSLKLNNEKRELLQQKERMTNWGDYQCDNWCSYWIPDLTSEYWNSIRFDSNWYCISGGFFKIQENILRFYTCLNSFTISIALHCINGCFNWTFVVNVYAKSSGPAWGVPRLHLQTTPPIWPIPSQIAVISCRVSCL